jgi:hypothetical protein
MLIEYALRISGPKRSWQKTIADHMQFWHRGSPKVVVALEETPDHPNIRSGYLRTTLELPQSAIWCTGVIAIVVYASCQRC